MNWYERRLTQEIKSLDPHLFVKTNGMGTRQILRRGTRFVSYQLDDGKTLIAIEPVDHYIMALTEDWTPKTQNVEWGALPVLARLNEIDSHKRDLAEISIQGLIKKEEREKRDMQNHVESYLYDFRDQFHKTFNDVNVSNMNKPKSKEI